MRFIPRLVFWIGVISVVYGMILKLMGYYGGAVGWPFGLCPRNFLDFGVVCFVGAISFAVVHVFMKKSE